jgi:hypothetical protein
VKHAIRLQLAEKSFNTGSVCDISFDEFNAGGYLIPLAMTQVIEHCHVMASLRKDRRDGATYVPGATSYQ